MRLEEWRGVVARIAERSSLGAVTLLVDMAYFAYGAHEPRAFLRELRPLLGKAALLFARSASKTFTHYGLRVGALVARLADAKERAVTENALELLVAAERGPTGTRGGQSAVTRLLTDRPAPGGSVR